MYANSIHSDTTRIIPVKRQNKVRTVTKLVSGDLSVTLHSGQSYTISKDDELFQSFVIWTVLNTQLTD
jgi:hypothetical protein